MAKGGKRAGAGRPAGAISKHRAEIKELAQQYGETALAELARLAKEAGSESARVAAIKELLDRGYGRPAQSVEMSGKGENGAIIVQIISGVPRAGEK